MDDTEMHDMKMHDMSSHNGSHPQSYAMDMSWMEMIEGRREAAGMRAGWSMGVEGLSTVVRVLPAELYDKLTTTEDPIPPNTSTPLGPGDAMHKHHENHGDTNKDDAKLPKQK